MREIVVALSTLPAEFDAGPLAAALVDRGLAACVTILPGVQSVYKWDGQVERSHEQQLVIKTTRDRVAALWIVLKDAHPYDVPEFVVLSIVEGNPDYLRWVGESVLPEGLR
jgi:periplasmic divalent cation tolerance protein